MLIGGADMAWNGAISTSSHLPRGRPGITTVLLLERAILLVHSGVLLPCCFLQMEGIRAVHVQRSILLLCTS